ncbi:hypothetical protein [Trichoplusia ni ascovirus 2c]|uniref:hypothetical protein n=1 Tax=Trichoplusia ni ascovirus 2c TaxID=328615 RepID=UPI0000E44278|nr:hypothetical protein TNAV2c_gp164 [Trichoplusia ni ascovirus 2c]ABF70679.1 hypothetical protein [Trichoplusia ni ascovirus 2c]
MSAVNKEVTPSTVTWVIRPMVSVPEFNQYLIRKTFPDAKLSFKNSISLRKLSAFPKIYFTGTVQLTGCVYTDDAVVSTIEYIYGKLLENTKLNVVGMTFEVTSIMANYSIKSKGTNESVGDLELVRTIMDDSPYTKECVFSKPHQLIARMKRPIIRISRLFKLLGNGKHEVVGRRPYIPKGKFTRKQPSGNITVYSNGSLNICSPSLKHLHVLVSDATKIRNHLIENNFKLKTTCCK